MATRNGRDATHKSSPGAPNYATSSDAPLQTEGLHYRQRNRLYHRSDDNQHTADEVDESTTEQEEVNLKSGTYNTSSPSASAPLSLKQKLSRFRIRSMWTLILVVLFLLILTAGHFYCSLLVIALTIGVYQEVIALKQNDEKDRLLPTFFLLRWYWFSVTIFAAGSQWLFPLLLALVGEPRRVIIEFIVTHHAMGSYIGGLGGFMLFIVSLRRFSLRYQFSQFALLLLTCIFVVGQSMVQIAIIYSGLIWFFLSSSCVIVNDIFAYIFGTFFGRTRLIKLSPNKTVEGYLGASIVTVIWAVIISTLLSKFPVFHCSKDAVTFQPYLMWHEEACATHTAYLPKQYDLPLFLFKLTGQQSFTAMPVQFHGLCIGLFAAFFAPFGGFFASGLKRTLKVKDFGHSIPGHGGLLDRFDCQILMGMFTYLYIRTFVFRQFGVLSIPSLMRHIKRLTPQDQNLLMTELKKLIITTANFSTEAIVAVS